MVHGKQHVLYVEDDHLIGSIGAEVMESLGYTVTWIDRADDAKAFLERGEHVDLLFTDVAMPGNWSGLDLAEWVHGLWPSLPVVIASGHWNSLGLHRPTFNILPKPYVVRDLAAVLERCLRTPVEA